MPEEIKQNGAGQPQETKGEGEGQPSEEVVSVKKADYDKLNETVGSLKREIKDLKKPKDEPKETPKNQPNDSLVEKAYLRSAQITDPEEVELALNTAKKWDMPLDKLVDDADFQAKLEKHRTQKSNERAASGVKGSGSSSSAKNTPEYWVSKGTYPTREEVPDRAVRDKIRDALMASAKNTRKFYND